ncbi:hypothetical protein [Avibacterium paragallinarum]|uniref:Uncharacterized protein n=1 Tax=Avibacterium paragallinarum TaxID=728 RepID=A0A380Z033_AVIPA|nr:hypothetical protein [Avibacterium paragallinarum]SUV40333.1 Uncharacterised protein [Avibacterium paragallinarum]
MEMVQNQLPKARWQVRGKDEIVYIVLTATFDFRDDEANEIGIKWSSTDGKALSEAPKELNFTIRDDDDCNYALTILVIYLSNLVKRSNPSQLLQC